MNTVFCEHDHRTEAGAARDGDENLWNMLSGVRSDMQAPPSSDRDSGRDVAVLCERALREGSGVRIVEEDVPFLSVWQRIADNNDRYRHYRLLFMAPDLAGSITATIAASRSRISCRS